MAFERTLVQIRERSFLDLLDLALIVCRRRPLILGLTALAGIAPFAALNAWLASTPEFPQGLLFLFIPIEIPWATAPLTIVLGGIMFGDRPSAGRVVTALLRSSGKMLLHQGLYRAVMILTVVPSLFIPARLTFLDEVILLERSRWKDVLKRSSALCGDRGTDMFLRVVMEFGFGLAFVVAFHHALRVAQAILIGGSVWSEMDDPDIWGWRTQLGLWIAIGFFGVVRFLTYIDQRIRLEGWEVELRLRGAGATVEEAEAW